MAMKVIVIGAGIAGPILAMLLKLKGFDVVVYEKHSHPTQGGLTIMVSPQSYVPFLASASAWLLLGVPMLTSAA